MKSTSMISFIISIAITSYAQGIEKNCLEVHLDEAIEINESRLPLYSKESQGRSESISQKMIWSEKILKFISPLIDFPARYWQNEGVPVACLDFISMSQTPSFLSQQRARTNPLPSFDTLHHQKELFLALWNSDADGLAEINRQIEDLSRAKSFHCMKRHLLESMGRSLSLLSFYESESQKRNLFSPRYFVLNLIYLQLAGMNFADWIDQEAYLLQKEGSGIICRDVPAIPIPGNISH